MVGQVNFSWQNPVLRNTIYPCREKKLREFLLTYRELDLWKARNDPSVLTEAQAEARRLATELKAERARAERELQAAIAQRKLTDKWFAVITGDTQERLYFKYSYYLDREIVRLTEAQAVLADRQKSLRRRIEWYTEGDTRRSGRTAKAGPAVASNQQSEKPPACDLLEMQKRLPSWILPGIRPEDAVRYKLEKYKKAGGPRSRPAGRAGGRLLRRAAPSGRFEKWVEYMVIHFSGMRYRVHTAPGPTRYLLELLTWEFLSEDIEDMDEAAKAGLPGNIAELGRRRPASGSNKIKAIDRQISRLQLWNHARPWQSTHGARMGEIQACRTMRRFSLPAGRAGTEAGTEDAIPDWMWTRSQIYFPAPRNPAGRLGENVARTLELRELPLAVNPGHLGTQGHHRLAPAPRENPRPNRHPGGLQRDRRAHPTPARPGSRCRADCQASLVSQAHEGGR
jgi:hypothetical protein